jgi:cytochrome c553
MQHKLIVLLLVTLVVIVGCANPDKKLSSDKTNQQPVTDIERGRYMVKDMGCNDCHTPDYMVKRGNIPEEDWLIGSTLGFRGSLGTTYPTNLRLLLNNISEEEWVALAKQMREGSPMTWVMLRKASDQDLRAVYAYVKYLGPKGVPAPNLLPPEVKPTTQYIDNPGPH